MYSERVLVDFLNSCPLPSKLKDISGTSIEELDGKLCFETDVSQKTCIADNFIYANLPLLGFSCDDSLN